MKGEIALAGIYFPTLLVAGAIAVAASLVVARVLTLAGAYRHLAHRPLVDLSIFVLLLGAIAILLDPSVR